jgi:hypothetical protein
MGARTIQLGSPTPRLRLPRLSVIRLVTKMARVPSGPHTLKRQGVRLPRSSSSGLFRVWMDSLGLR